MQRAKAYIHRMKRIACSIGQCVLELVWPTRCACCEKLGTLLCTSCAESLPRIDQDLACPRCGAPLGKLVCTECTPIYEPQSFAFTQARCALEFTGETRRIILAYKDGNERRLASLLARFIVDAVPLEWRLWADVLTWIPTDAESYRRRGFDHMESIARSIQEQTGLPAAPLLEKRTGVDQRKLNRTERRQNMEELFVVIDTKRERGEGDAPALLRNAHVILIDDVFTTGATLNAAAQVLHDAKVGEIRVATIARVW